MEENFTNSLIRETSPYLLQHAHNPVHWHPWKKQTLQKARSKNKLLLISIGYAACHWCHVMEKESFEDQEVAAVMNARFINIKVDREERPDIDHLYMNAIQLMTGGGGWPLNVIALPDGSPVWGGTYFPKAQWIRILEQLAELYTDDPDKMLRYAVQLQQGLTALNHIAPAKDNRRPAPQDIEKAVAQWIPYFDDEYGGMKRAPKFMMPVTLGFLLHYAVQTQHTTVLNHVENTLVKMAFGGVYDHVGGGFSRYSVDEKWHIPHFEKMLYDNAQLVSLYSDAYRLTRKALYRDVVEKTLLFVERELTHPRGAFYSSLDADSLNREGKQEEGAFYVWKKDELQQALKEDFPVFAGYYNINAFGHWEKGNHVLIRTASEDEIAAKHHSTAAAVKTTVDGCLKTLFKLRNTRSRPGLDDKTLTSWNALMLKAYTDAYKALGNEKYRNSALKNAEFLVRNQYTGTGGLFHSFRNGKSSVNGFLEDYAALCDAFIGLYEITCNESWLAEARQLAHYCYDNFYDRKSGFFFFTGPGDALIIPGIIERADNVIPASNSVLAKALVKLSRYFGNDSYVKTAENMLFCLREEALQYPYNYANWLDLALQLNHGYEIAIAGEKAKTTLNALTKHYLPGAVTAAAETASGLSLLKNRYIPGKTLIYVCRNNSCRLPVETVEEALKQITGS